MELSLTFAKVLQANEAAFALIDAPFANPVTAVKVAQLHRTLQPLFDDISTRHNAILEKYAERDEDGNIVYADEAKTRVKPTAEMLTRIDEFLSGTIDVSLPTLDAVKFDLEGGANLPAESIVPFARLFQLPLRKATIKRGDIGGAADSLGWLLGETFAAGCTGPKIARLFAILSEQVMAQNTRRTEIAKQHAVRGGDGEIVYADKEKQKFAITPPAAVEIAQYDAEEIELELPELSAEDLTLSSGKGLSARRIYGLMPILVQY